MFVFIVIVLFVVVVLFLIVWRILRMIFGFWGFVGIVVLLVEVFISCRYR